jgi:hypothetical protein
METITVTLVLTDGQVDTGATTEAFDSLLNTYVNNRSAQTEQIAAAVMEVLTEANGRPIAMPTVGSMAAFKLNALSENFAVVQERAIQYIRDNSQTSTIKSEVEGEEDVVIHHPDSLFVIQKGFGGGVTTRANYKPKPVKVTKKAAK